MPDASRNAVVVVGSANLEQLVELSEQDALAPGGKHSVNLRHHCGGSGVNIARRLLARGCSVFPVLTYGDDVAGETVSEALATAAGEGGLLPSVRSAWDDLPLMAIHADTPTSIIVVHRTDRTVFRQRLATREGYLPELRDRLERAFRRTPAPDSLVLGHVPVGNEQPHAVAEKLVDLLARLPQDTFVHTVLGTGQLQLGWRFWEDSLRERVDLFQLNVTEAQAFFSDDGSVPSVSEILERLWEMRLTAILTMDRFGAIGTHRSSRNLFIAWPLIRGEDVVDSTGAGDAFAAGMTWELIRCGGSCDIGPFQSALRIGSQWAAAACTTFGGSGTHPAAELDRFLERHDVVEDNTEMRRLESAAEILNFIDLAFQPRR